MNPIEPRIEHPETSPIDTDRNIWQKVSDATGTVVTPANAIDLAGFVGAKYGIDNIDNLKGIAVTSASFAADIADGWVARKTGTESELGEALDAAGDKAKMTYGLLKIWKKDLAPKYLLAAVAMQNSVNAGLTITDRVVNWKEPALHPSWFGKRAILLQQSGIGLHVVGSHMEKNDVRFHNAVKAAGTVLGLSGVALGVVASAGYSKTLRQSKRKN